MQESNLTPEQFSLYLSILNSIEMYRMLTEEEKEDLIYQITTTPYIDLMCDWAFKHVFGHNEAHLKMLLNDFLPEKIEHIKFDANELDPFKGDDKQVIMDVLCYTKTGKFIVEMQKALNDEFRNRMLYYGAASVFKQLKMGDKYKKLVPVYVICFMNFRLQHSTNQLVYRYQVREQDSGELYGNQLSIYFCELPRFIKSRKNMTPVEEWFEIIRNMSTFAAKPEHVNKRYDTIFDACKQFRLNDQEQEQYFRAMLTAEDRQSIAHANFEEGRAIGRDEGRQEALEELRAFIASGLSIEEIAQKWGQKPAKQE